MYVNESVVIQPVDNGEKQPAEESAEPKPISSSIRVDFSKIRHKKKKGGVRIDTLCIVHACMPVEIPDEQNPGNKIVIQKSAKVLGRGLASQYYSDGYNKYLGKKIALERALIGCPHDPDSCGLHHAGGNHEIIQKLPKAIRKVIWKEFFHLVRTFSGIPWEIYQIGVGKERFEDAELNDLEDMIEKTREAQRSADSMVKAFCNVFRFYKQDQPERYAQLVEEGILPGEIIKKVEETDEVVRPGHKDAGQ
jgi:hypothetical protein